MFRHPTWNKLFELDQHALQMRRSFNEFAKLSTSICCDNLVMPPNVQLQVLFGFKPLFEDGS